MSNLERLSKKFPQGVLETHSAFGDDVAIVHKEKIQEILSFLKSEPELDFNFLMDLTVVDYLSLHQKPRFEIVYHLYSLNHRHRVRIKAPVDECDPVIASAVSLWPIADWLEREAWDMFGIRFLGHPHLKRILMYEEFKGHPLRKDYPVNKRQPLIGPKN